MQGRRSTYKEINQLKKDNILEMPWNFLEEFDFIYLYEKNNDICAVIKISIDPVDADIIWIDEFEIVRKYRKQGIGRRIICELLEDCNNTVKLLAKNSIVADFWYKCGFQYENISNEEIEMKYSKN